MTNPLQPETTDAVVAAELMVSDRVQAAFSPEQVIRCVIRALEGEVGDRPTAEHAQKHSVMKSLSPVLVVRFETTDTDGEASLFVMVFRKTPAVYVGVLADFQELFAASGEPELDHFNSSPSRAVMAMLVPLREGESLYDPPSDMEKGAFAFGAALNTVLHPSDAVRPELN